MKNYGYIFEPTKPEDHIFGGFKSAPYETLVPDGNWKPFLPQGEYQSRGGVETNACVTFSILNGLEALRKRLFGDDENKSDRFTAIVSDTTPQGNSPTKVGDAVRNKGVIDEMFLPFNNGMSYETFFSPRPMTSNYLNKGEEWVNDFEFSYEYIVNGGEVRRQDLIAALMVSPVPISVYAWVFDNEKQLYTKSKGQQDNHFCLLVNYEEGKFWEVFDSYDGFIKKLSWDYDFTTALRISLGKKLTPAQISIFSQILTILTKILKLDFSWLSLVHQNSEISQNPAIVAPQSPKDDLIPPPAPESPTTPKSSKLILFADAITAFENSEKFYSSYFNPGNLKFTDYTKSLGAYKAGKNNFCMFYNPEDGRNALCQFVKDAASDKLKDYHDCSIRSFFQSYSGENQLPYAKFVSVKVDENIEAKLKDFI